MAKNSLQHDHVAAIHYEVQCKGVPKDARELAVFRREARAFNRIAEG